jgi:isobutyryl-CoA mutase
MVDLLKSRGGEHIQVFGGGGGVIVPPEIRELQAYGVTRIYSPEDGQRMGLAGMIGEMVMRCDKDLTAYAPNPGGDAGPRRDELACAGPVHHRP